MRPSGLRCIGAALAALILACILAPSSAADQNALTQAAAPAVQQATAPVADAVQQAAPVADEAAATVEQAAQPVAAATAGTAKPGNDAVAPATRSVAATAAETTEPLAHSVERTTKPVVTTTQRAAEPVVKDVARTAERAVEPVVKDVARTAERAVEPVVKDVARTTTPLLDAGERSAKPVVADQHAAEPGAGANVRSIAPDRPGASVAPAIAPATGAARPALAPAGDGSVRSVVAERAPRPEGRDSLRQANRLALTTELLPTAALDRNRAGTAAPDVRRMNGSEPAQSPAPAPAGVAVAGGGSATGGATSTFFFLGLAALTAWAIPGVLRRLRVASDPWRPTAFALILERPG